MIQLIGIIISKLLEHSQSLMLVISMNNLRSLLLLVVEQGVNALVAVVVLVVLL